MTSPSRASTASASAPACPLTARTFANLGNVAWIPSSTVADAMFGYYAAHWDAQIGVKNITNVTYYTTAESAGGASACRAPSTPRPSWHY